MHPTLRKVFVPVVLAAVAVGAAGGPEATVPIQAEITHVDVQKGEVTLNCGKDKGVVAKMVFRVYGQGEVIRLPLIGKQIVEVPKEIGSVRVIDVADKSARGEVFGVDPAQIQPKSVAIGFPIPTGPSLKPTVLDLALVSATGAAPGAIPEAAAGTRVLLTARSHNSEGSTVTYKWTASAGRLAQASTVDGTNELWVPPQEGKVKVSVVAIAPEGLYSDPKEVEIAVKPVTDELRGKPYRLTRILAPLAPFDHISGMAVDRSNNLYVVDSKRKQVCKVGPDRRTDAVGFMGRGGSEEGQFSVPTACACFESALFVVDQGRCKVIQFDKDGAYHNEFGGKGTDNGQFQEPVSIAISRRGDVYVLDAKGAHVQVFDQNGNFVVRLGRRGTQPGQFNRPVAIALDRQDNLYVLDQGKGLVVCFSRDFRWLREIQVGPASACVLDPQEEGMYLLYPEEQAVKRVSFAKGEFDPAYGKVGGTGEDPGQLTQPAVLAVDLFGDLYVSDDARKGPAVQRFRNGKEFAGKWGGEDYGKVARTASTPSGDLVCLSDDATLRVLSRWGWTLARFGGKGKEQGKLVDPKDVALGPDGKIYVVDYELCQILRYLPNGQFDGEFCKDPEKDRQQDYIRRPADLAGGPSTLALWEEKFGRVQIFSAASGKREKVLGSSKGDDDVSKGKKVALGPDGAIYVSYGGDGVKAFGPDGAFRERWGKEGNEDGQLKEIEDMETDPAGTLFILDASRKDCQRFTSKGVFLSRMKDEGQMPKPADLAVTPYSEVWIWDREKKWALLWTQD